MAIVIWAVSPHPPLLIPGVADEIKTQAEHTRQSLIKMAQAVKQAQPERIIVLSPHAPSVYKRIVFFSLAAYRGSMARFNHPEVSLSFSGDLQFSERLSQLAESQKLPVLPVNEAALRRYQIEESIDHGAFVPLFYLQQAGLDVPIVIISTAGADFADYRRLGQVLRQLLAESEEKTAIVASGDLSHKLLVRGPYGFDEQGPGFDALVVEALKHGDGQDLQKISPQTISSAGQCGLGSLEAMFACLPSNAEAHFLSYEGPYGVGYGVSYYTLQGEPQWPQTCQTSTFSEVASEEEKNQADQTDRKDEASSVEGSSAEEEVSATAKLDIRLQVARQAVEAFVRDGQRLDVSKLIDDGTSSPSGAFVTLKENGDLRGCIGTLSPTCGNQLEEIVQNAISACSRDPRFAPVEASELPNLHYQVYLLREPVPVSSYKDLDPKRYGVIVRKGRRCGVLLPNLEGIDTVEMQVGIACRKGGIMPSENPNLSRFETVVYEEPPLS